MRNLNYLSLLDLQFPGTSVCFLHSRGTVASTCLTQAFNVTLSHQNPLNALAAGQVPVLPDHRMTYGG